MNSQQALDAFWNSFGWDAYDVNTVPSSELGPTLPRITYEVARSGFDETVYLSASLWDNSYSWESVTLKANEIYNRIGIGGIILNYDGGRIWLKRGSPFSQRMADEDDRIRRIYMNIEAEYITAN